MFNRSVSLARLMPIPMFITALLAGLLIMGFHNWQVFERALRKPRFLI
jgi:hypothetical protein